MSRSEHRGGSWLASGEGVVMAAQDRAVGFTEMIPPGEDASTMIGAQALKRRIEAYWKERGRAVSCRIEKGLFGTWAVRSTLVDGLPL